MKILPTSVILAVCVLNLVPAFAAPPTVPSPSAQSITIPLQHITPEAVIKAMHWNQNTPNVIPHFGSANIQAQDKDNSLRVQGSPTVIKKVQEIVHELDIAPLTVSIKLAIFKTSQDIVQNSGIDFSLLPVPAQSRNSVFYSASVDAGSEKMQTLLKTNHTPTLAAPQIITTNNTAATIRLQDADNGELSFTGSPRINSDQSITIDMTLPTTNGQTGHLLETVSDGHTLVLVSPPDADHQVQITFVTPTVIGR